MKSYILIISIMFLIEFLLFGAKLEEWRVLREYSNIYCGVLGAIVFNMLSIVTVCEIERWHRQED